MEENDANRLPDQRSLYLSHQNVPAGTLLCPRQHLYFCKCLCIIVVTIYVLRYRELGENMTDDELRAMIDEFDTDGDGESMYQCFHFPF